jgi:hypothetical protein
MVTKNVIGLLPNRTFRPNVFAGLGPAGLVPGSTLLFALFLGPLRPRKSRLAACPAKKRRVARELVENGLFSRGRNTHFSEEII